MQKEKEAEKREKEIGNNDRKRDSPIKRKFMEVL